MIISMTVNIRNGHDKRSFLTLAIKIKSKLNFINLNKNRMSQTLLILKQVTFNFFIVRHSIVKKINNKFFTKKKERLKLFKQKCHRIQKLC